VGEGPAPAAVFLGNVAEQHTYFASLYPSLGIRVALFTPANLVWHELPLYKLTNRSAEHPQLIIHPRGLVGKGRHFLTPLQSILISFLMRSL
jgi:hypothetical protein